MDSRTLHYYDTNAEEVFARYTAADSGASGVARYFRAAFPAGSRILDIGSGSGRDLSTLVEESYPAYGVEPSEPLRRRAQAGYPHLQGRIAAGALPDLGEQKPDHYDAVLCSAVFMHIPEEQHFDAAFAIRRVLKPHGRLLLSLPVERPDVGGDDRDAYGRLFVPVVPESLSLLFERLGFLRISRWEDADSLGRSVRWVTLLFELQAGSGVRPIDQIEGVLSRDKKTATYKLALFRALNDIALTRQHLARWTSDGWVGVPIRVVAEQWIWYYWPLVEGDPGHGVDFVPQIRGEKADRGKPIAFRPLLTELVETFRPLGGLEAFHEALRDGRLHHTGGKVEALLKKIANTIHKGPVTYAGGSLQGEHGEPVELFRWNARGGMLHVAGPIWRELSLSGHWIRDALILRWAELTADISGKALSPRDVINLLLRAPDPERDVLVARKIYEGLRQKECVWSGKRLGNQFAVDHVLPYSMWKNNDLWNLLPTDARVNGRKSDKLPTREQFRHSRDRIIHYWEVLEAAAPRRFEVETGRLVGAEKPGLDAVYRVLVESVEQTALQFGSERWDWG